MIKAKLLILMFISTLFSYSQTITDLNGDTLFSIDTNGIIRDVEDNQIGKFNEDGKVYDSENNIIGEIDGSNFKDYTGELNIGQLNEFNQVIDINGQAVGEIDNGINVKDSNNHIIARASDSVNPMWLAAYFFFFFHAI